MTRSTQTRRNADIDLMGLGGGALCLILGWWLVVAPWMSTWSDYRAVALRRAEASAGLRDDVHELERFQVGLVQLEDAVTSQSDAVPHATSTSSLLREMTAIAEDCSLKLLSVAPQPAANDGKYVVTDVQVAGRGSSHDFIRFLDRFAQQNPYQALRFCSITRLPDSDSPDCELAWAVRLYLLPPGTEG